MGLGAMKGVRSRNDVRRKVCEEVRHLREVEFGSHVRGSVWEPNKR